MERVNADDLDWSELSEGSTHFRRKGLAAATDNDDLGASLYELPPGASGWPYHYHTANAEAVFVLAGAGTVRHGGEDGDEETAIEPGDYLVFPPDESGAHRLHNDGDEALRVLVTSTMRDPEVLAYPDSGKVGVMAGAPPGDHSGRTLEGYYREEDAVDYWDGEE